MHPRKKIARSTVKPEMVGIGEVVKISRASNSSDDISWTTFKSYLRIGSEIGTSIGQIILIGLGSKLGSIIGPSLVLTLVTHLQQQ